MDGICVGFNRRGMSWYRWARGAGLNVVGVVDLNEPLLHQHADELDIPREQRFTSIAEAAANTSAKVATICTANSAHSVCIKQTLDAGLHTIVEKPFVEQPAEAQQLVDKANSLGLQLAVAQNYRFAAINATVRKLLDDEAIGQVETIHADFVRWRPAPGMKLPLLLNQGIHHFDAARFLLQGDPVSVFARIWNPKWGPSDEATAMEAVWTIRTPDGRDVPFSYSGNYNAQGAITPFSGRWRIEGSTGSITAEGDGDNVTVQMHRRDPESTETVDPVIPDLQSSSFVCRTFLQALEANETPPTVASDNLRSLSMCWDAMLSSQRNQVVESGTALASGVTF